MNKRFEGFDGFEDIEDPRERALAQRIEENLSHFAEVEPPTNMWAKIAARLESEEPVRPVVEPELAPTPLFPQAARRSFSWSWLALPAFGALAAVAIMATSMAPRSDVVKAAIPGAATAPGEAVQLLPSMAPSTEASHWDQVSEAFRSYLSSHGSADAGRSP